MTDSPHPLKLLREMQRAGVISIALACVAPCKRCGFREDLRMGACFRCADFIKGKDHGDGIHELWDRDNPSNRWIVSIT